MHTAWSPKREVQTTITSATGPSLQYLAGFFDGEGCFSCDVPRDKTSIQFRCTITTTREEEPQWFLDRFGGNLGSIDPEKDTHSKSWKWEASGQTARVATEALIPHLRGKREQASVFIDAIKHKYRTKTTGSFPWTDSEIETMHEYGERLRSMNSAQRNFAEED
jgi:hypothetical protein